MSRTYCITSAILFGMVSLLHLWRAVLDLPLTVGLWAVPRSFSILGAIVTAAMAVWAVRSVRPIKSVRIAYT